MRPVIPLDCSLALVEGAGQLAVGFSGGCQLGLSLFQGRRKVDVVLFQAGDLVLEFVDVGGGTQARLAPDLLSPCLGQALLQLLDARDQAGVAGLGVGEVCLERGAADGVAPAGS
ncbi:hypothetical protein [Streptomyces soliscabiei]|uniref:hypothetical protein n=1 Tax=Streptomyces soliscabiei TaxID=588897 RepID=UPI0029AA364D|nr:hypothetical protein [Streptomyces sp. NY05-11A]MDX2677835.1 hypothetical protein [Streptomyces sp. NY05-11A]